MDRWLNDGPGLAYVKELCTWVVVSTKGELICWTDDPAEIAWLSLWVLQYKPTIKEADRATDNRALKAGGRRPRRFLHAEVSEPPALLYGSGKKRRPCMSVKASSHARIKTIKVICDRCKQIVEGIRGEQFTSGFYDMTKWEEYRRENEQYVCDSCMFADPKYVEHYGSCF